MDVKARRNLWDLLIQEKKGRTILLSTHYMEEAEVLNDRIAIMNEGKLKTIGTSFFLKKKFGSGYKLIVVKKENCRSNEIEQVIKKYAPDVIIESEEQKEVTFILSEEYLDKFDKIFKQLEDESEVLGISSFGCSISTLEEVFLKVGVDKVQNDDNETAIKLSNSMLTKEVSKIQLFFNQIYALVLKKIHFTRRNISPYIFLTFFTILISAAILYIPLNLDVDYEITLSGLIETKFQNSTIFGIYKSFFRESKVEVIDENIRDFIYGHFIKRNLKYEIGVAFDAQPVEIWFNGHSFLNSVLYALNYYHRAVLKSLCTSCDIRLLYDQYDMIRPETTTRSSSEPPQEEESVSQFQELLIYLLFIFVTTYWSSIHIIMRISERVTKAKLLQFISGVNRFLYTIVTYLIDFAIFLIVLCIVFGVVAAAGKSGFNTMDDFILYLTVFTLYSFNIIAWIYLLALIFQNPLAGETAATFITLGCKFYITN